MDNELESYTPQGTIKNEVLIKFIEDYSTKIKEPTVIVLDNPAIHKSKFFQSKIEEWKKLDLGFLLLPRYSPELRT